MSPEGPRFQGAGVVLEGVSKSYGSGRTAVHALRDVDLEIEPGELAVILGPSGSGKTTLLNVIGGIEPPTSGRVAVADRDIGSLSEDERTAFRKDNLGFVFQFFNLIPTLTARENVELVAELTGTEDAPRRTERVLSAVGLRDRTTHFPGQLSGGEQQRVAIARALVKLPSVLLCDEPTGSLDLDTGRRVLGVLQRLHSFGMTILIVTHNSAIAEMAHRVIEMHSGDISSSRSVRKPKPASELHW